MDLSALLRDRVKENSSYHDDKRMPCLLWEKGDESAAHLGMALERIGFRTVSIPSDWKGTLFELCQGFLPWIYGGRVGSRDCYLLWICSRPPNFMDNSNIAIKDDIKSLSGLTIDCLLLYSGNQHNTHLSNLSLFRYVLILDAVDNFTKEDTATLLLILGAYCAGPLEAEILNLTGNTVHVYAIRHTSVEWDLATRLCARIESLLCGMGRDADKEWREGLGAHPPWDKLYNLMPLPGPFDLPIHCDRQELLQAIQNGISVEDGLRLVFGEYDGMVMPEYLFLQVRRKLPVLFEPSFQAAHIIDRRYTESALVESYFRHNIEFLDDSVQGRVRLELEKAIQGLHEAERKRRDVMDVPLTRNERMVWATMNRRIHHAFDSYAKAWNECTGYLYQCAWWDRVQIFLKKCSPMERSRVRESLREAVRQAKQILFGFDYYRFGELSEKDYLSAIRDAMDNGFQSHSSQSWRNANPETILATMDSQVDFEERPENLFRFFRNISRRANRLFPVDASGMTCLFLSDKYSELLRKLITEESHLSQHWDGACPISQMDNGFQITSSTAGIPIILLRSLDRRVLWELRLDIREEGEA